MMKNNKYPYIISAHPHYGKYGNGSYLAPFCDASLTKSSPLPLVELVYGSYPERSSHVQNCKPPLTLHQLIHRQAEDLLGKTQNKELGFLLKLIAIETPQSLHFHPDEAQSIQGFRKESLEQRSIEDRFFLDNKVKIETLYALEDDFTLLLGFLPYDIIIERLETLGIRSLLKEASVFQANPSEVNLQNLLITLFQYEPRQQEVVINQILSIAEDYQDIYPYYAQILELSQHFSNDIAIIMPLFLQSYTLSKNQAITIMPNTPHAILRGVAVELSSTSLNTIHLALTTHRRDPDSWSHVQSNHLPSIIEHDLHNPDLPLSSDLPLRLQVVHLEDHFFINGKNPPLILLTLKGKARLSSAAGNRYRELLEQDDLALTRGEALFLPNEAGGYELKGRGLFVIAWSVLM